MATIKPIEGRSVHQIQSGQVIVDLCSVVKELLENSVDAGASVLDIRFRNNGLDSIEVQDNGAGVGIDDYETIALKHYTSKLSNYDDLTSLTTFGFRGEALSSLCALSDFHITTARADTAPKGNKLEFEVSGKLKSTTVVASQKGTTVVVENIFRNLPVRRKELEKNIKREYGKVLNLLHAYACISVNTKITVSNQPLKGKRTIAFSTKANLTTRENIANVYGARTLAALIPLDLTLQMQSTNGVRIGTGVATAKSEAREVKIVGHISRPVIGEGRQAPDRQMFFVNGRPCSLPQISRAINEVYKSYNVTQSAFIFADLRMDTEAYDVNISPDKREILLHDQTELLEELKVELHDAFEAHDQSVPQAQLNSNQTLSLRTSSTIGGGMLASRQRYSTGVGQGINEELENTSVVLSEPAEAQATAQPVGLLRSFVARDTLDRGDLVVRNRQKAAAVKQTLGLLEFSGGDTDFRKASELLDREQDSEGLFMSREPSPVTCADSRDAPDHTISKPVQDFNARMASQSRRMRTGLPVAQTDESSDEEAIPSVKTSPIKEAPGVVQNAFNKMRPQRAPNDTAIITIGDVTTIAKIGNSGSKRRKIHHPKFDLSGKSLSQSSLSFRSTLQPFAAPGTRRSNSDSEEQAESEAEDEDRRQDEPLSNINPINNESPGAQSEASELLDETQISGMTKAKLNNEFSDDGSDDDYFDEETRKAQEDAKVARMIAHAEEAAARPTGTNIRRATAVLNGKVRKEATLQLACTVEASLEGIEQSANSLSSLLKNSFVGSGRQRPLVRQDSENTSAEERLSLTVSKADFGRMRIAGQFNLGFILTIRPGQPRDDVAKVDSVQSRAYTDELFIVDQHASDEKYNFERLQSETIVQYQRLVQPKKLDLTAVEEEIILNHPDALVKNGFVVDTDESGETPTGRRCSLISLPMSREVVFDLRDLEELLALLAESAGSEAPRPSKVRKMFAMRACRGSIMVGKTLTTKQMEKVVRHMGEIDKPWNCPHGRPTMRHLYGIDGWEPWQEGNGLRDPDEDYHSRIGWGKFLESEPGDVEDDIEDD